MGKSKEYKIAWLVSVIFLIIGIILVSKEIKRYPTNTYWVAKNYHHVYEQDTGKIVDYIEDDEKCEIDGSEITVSKLKFGLLGNAFGWLIISTSGSIILGLIIYLFSPKNDNTTQSNV